jgi:hypothetical protein
MFSGWTSRARKDERTGSESAGSSGQDRSWFSRMEGRHSQTLFNRRTQSGQNQLGIWENPEAGISGPGM